MIEKMDIQCTQNVLSLFELPAHTVILPLGKTFVLVFEKTANQNVISNKYSILIGIIVGHKFRSRTPKFYDHEDMSFLYIVLWCVFTMIWLFPSYGSVQHSKCSENINIAT